MQLEPNFFFKTQGGRKHHSQELEQETVSGRCHCLVRSSRPSRLSSIPARRECEPYFYPRNRHPAFFSFPQQRRRGSSGRALIRDWRVPQSPSPMREIIHQHETLRLLAPEPWTGPGLHSRLQVRPCPGFKLQREPSLTSPSCLLYAAVLSVRRAASLAEPTQPSVHLCPPPSTWE